MPVQVEVGKVYTFRGGHELLVDEVYATPPKVIPFTGWEPVVLTRGHGNIRGSVALADVLREATPEAIRLSHANALVRNVACRAPDCWCRAYLQE